MRQMLRQTTGYGQTGICFVMTKTAMLKGYTLKVVCEICGKVSGHYSDRFVTTTNGSSLLIICIGPRNGQAVVEMKRFLKPRSGCGRPDLGENVHRKSQASLALPICLNENVPFKGYRGFFVKEKKKFNIKSRSTTEESCFHKETLCHQQQCKNCSYLQSACRPSTCLLSQRYICRRP